jgi:ferrous iron transport protein B
VDRDLIIALAGNPNSGKTTLFNALTGLRQKVANYPGVTVERKTGRVQLPDSTWADVIDLPGTYSLVARSPDEVIASEVVRGVRGRDTGVPDVVVAVVDASNLARNLYLVSQLLELGRPTVIALTMVDIAERRGNPVSASELEKRLKVPVVPVVGHKGTGVDELLRRVAGAAAGGVPVAPTYELPPVLRRQVDRVGVVIPPGNAAAWLAIRLLVGDGGADLDALRTDRAVQDAVRVGLAELSEAEIDPVKEDIEARYRWIDAVVSELGLHTHASAPVSTRKPTFTQRLDRVLVHRVWGLGIFALIMAVLFVSIFTLATPLMDAMEGGVQWLGALVTGLLPDGPVKDLWTDGIVAGVGGVVVFIPQIAILFAFLAILEDSGYLARAAFLMDRLLRGVGLSGKAFVPLLSSYACAIPGIMATRTMESPRQRLATIFVAPFMSCSARLPVYALLISAFFASSGAMAQAGIMLGLYALGTVAAFATAWVFTRFGNHEPVGSFILELPTYKRPQLRQVARQVWTSTSQFVTRAGTVIFSLSIVLWAAMYYPRMPAAAIVGLDEQQAAAAQLRQSVAGRFGHAIEPVIKPLGYDWKMGVGLVGAFAAREVFVSTMGIVYAAGDVEDDTTALRDAMAADKYPDGRPVWNAAVACSLLVWFVLAMQCISTLAIVWRETRSWVWPVLMLLYMNALAWVLAWITYRVALSVLVGS